MMRTDAVGVCALITLLLGAVSMGRSYADATAADGGPLRLLSAYYMPDPRPPEDSQNVEGDMKPRQYGLIFAPMQRLYQEHAEFGGLRVVLHNVSDAEVQIQGVRLSGTPITEHYVDFLNDDWDTRGVVWHRVRPETVGPGEASEVYIRFRRRPAGPEATVALELSNGNTLQTVVPYTQPAMHVDYVTTGADRQRLYVYVRRNGQDALGPLQDLSLDGMPLQDVKIYGPGFPGGVSLAVARLPEPLQLGAYHVVGVGTASPLLHPGVSVAAQFRVLPFFFMRWSWRYMPRNPDEVRELGMNFTERAMSLERAEELGVYTSSGGHARQIWEYMYDEPDAKDVHPRFGAEQWERFRRQTLGLTEPLDDLDFRQQHRAYDGLGHAVGLGRLARDTILPRNREIESRRPPVATYLITNGTTRPLNFFVYGQVTDIAGTDPYPVNYYGGDLTTIREAYTLMRRAAKPRPTYACMESFTWDQFLEESPDALRRAPSAAEFRQMAVQALGCGVKGYTSWFWGRGSGMTGAGLLPHLRAEYIRLNRLTEHIEEELLLGTPVDLVSNDAGLVPLTPFHLDADPYEFPEPWMKERVWTAALLCGPDALVIAAANHLPPSRMTPTEIEPARDVNITVQLPDFLLEVECFEVDDAGLHAYPCRIAGDRALINLQSLESGRIFLLRRPSERAQAGR